MNKYLLTAAALSVIASPAFAITTTGTAWGCTDYSTETNWCVAKVTSATTADQLGVVKVDPNKSVYTFATGAAAVNGVSTTYNLKLNGNATGAVNVSNTAAGNPAAFTVPYFNTMAVSVSAPATISSTNSLIYTVIEK